MGRLSAIGTIIALVVGAGVLGIPYVVSGAGFWNGFLQIFIIGILILLLNLYVGEVVLSTKGRHHLVELAEHYLGKNGGKLMFLTFVLGQYGALIAYLVGIKNVLITIFGGLGWPITIFIFTAMALLLFLRLHVIANVESFLTFVMLGLIAIICLALFPTVDYTNFTTIGQAPLSSYGVILFSYLGFTIIPEVLKQLKNKKDLVNVVFDSFLIIMMINALFAYVFVGVFGVNVSEVATNSLTGSLLLIGGFLVLSMLVTSYLGVGLVIKDMFVMDFELKKISAWILTIIPPFLFFFIAKPDFIRIIGLVGGVTGGIAGILVCRMVLFARRKGNRKPEYRVWGDSIPVYVLILVLLAGMVWEITRVL